MNRANALLIGLALVLAGCVSAAERARALNPDNRPAATVAIGSAVLVPGRGSPRPTLTELATREFAGRKRFLLRATGNDRAMALLCKDKGAVNSAILDGRAEIVQPDLVFMTREPRLEETKSCQANGRNPVFERLANYKGGLPDAAIKGIYVVWDERLARPDAIWYLNSIRDNGRTLLANPAYAPHFDALY